MNDDPVAVNDANAEPWWQSGVGVFGTGGLVWSVGSLIAEIGTNGLDIASYDADKTVTAVGALVAFAGVLYRRFKPGLKPMFHRFGP